MHGLMLAFAFSLPYHVMRTAATAGVRVHVLGNGPSRGLRRSRFCASYQESRAVPNRDNDAETILAEIAKLAEQRSIDVVFPSDDVSTRLLATIRDRLPVRCGLLPDPITFDLLNNKWNFCRFARDHGARVPETWLCSDAAELRRALRSGALQLPLTFKPINRSGGFGVVHLKDEADLRLLAGVDYVPILVQRCIAGRTIGLSVLCRDGQIRMHATQWYDARRFRLFVNRDLLNNAARVVAAARLDGPAHFDAILEDGSGLSYIVECNPRFWFSINLPMLCGINFVSAALAGSAASEIVTVASAEVCRSSKSLFAGPWRARRQDWRYLHYKLSDPLAYLSQRCKTYDDRDIAVDAARMIEYQPAKNAASQPLSVPAI